MNKNERVTKEYLTEQLALEKSRLENWMENLRIHKEILQTLTMDSSKQALNIATKNIERLTLKL